MKGARDLGTREERADATEGARIASEVSRKSAAVQRQAQILELEVEMMTAGLPHTTADVAREANERDLRTAQGLHWSARSVRDAVREAKSYATR